MGSYSFEQIYDLYFKDVYRYLLSLCRNAAEAEEITRETFFQAMKTLPSFRGDCKITVWLCQIARHLYFADQKKQKRRQEILRHVPGLSAAAPASDSRAVPAPYPSPEQLLFNEADAMQIHQLPHQLEEPYKEVFMLRFFGELPFRKIAHIFGKSENRARVTYHWAKLKIISEMEDQNA